MENWRKASYSVHNGGCVETATATGVVGIRDTTQAGVRDRVTLQVSPAAWSKFIIPLKALR
jgi:hypothetical protein